MLQLLAVISCSIALLLSLVDNYLKTIYGRTYFQVVSKIFIIVFAILFVVSWLNLCRIFYIIFGSLYHLRKKRFLKYTKLIGWFYEKFLHKSFYEKNYRKRRTLMINSLSINSEELSKRIKKGGTILLLYEDTTDYSKLIFDFIIETINDQETVDYVSTFRTPIELCKYFSTDQITKVTKKLSIIDCFTPHYSFDDKVIKYKKDEYSKMGFKFYKAESFAEIHTATNNSWYRFRDICKSEENQFRIPHRTVYDTLSSLIRFSSEELYVLFLRHVIYSEKNYGMISLIVEPSSLKDDIKNDLKRMADIVIEYNGGSFSFIK